jgi:YtkA-like
MLLPTLPHLCRCWPLSRVFHLMVLLIVLPFALTACGRMESAAPTADDGYTVTMVSQPEAPSVGPGALTITLRDPAGAPVENATLAVVGNMSHAGMVPVTGVVQSSAGGAYKVAIDWTMSGDWYVDVTAQVPDGEEIVRRFPIRVK